MVLLGNRITGQLLTSRQNACVVVGVMILVGVMVVVRVVEVVVASAGVVVFGVVFCVVLIVTTSSVVLLVIMVVVVVVVIQNVIVIVFLFSDISKWQTGLEFCSLACLFMSSSTCCVTSFSSRKSPKPYVTMF